MNWQDFLNHPNVEGKRQEEPGKYLFGLVMHDSLHFLNNIKAAVRLDKDAQILPEKTRAWLHDWNACFISKWIEKYSELQREISNPCSAERWEEHVKKAREIPEELSLMIAKIDEWDFPDNDLLSLVIGNIRDLSGLCHIIEQGDYLLIWGTIYRLHPHGKFLYRNYLNG